MKFSRNKPIRQWWQRFAEIADIETTDPSLKRRGQLLAFYIALIWGILAYVTVNNIVYLYFYPSLEYTIYLAQEIAIFILFYIFWRMNQKGRVLLTAYISITLTILLGILMSEPSYLEYSMVVFALPIGMSSFIIRPSMSFWYAFLTTAAFTAVSLYSNYVWEYNLSATLALFALAFMTWIAAQQLENSLKENEELVRDLQRTFQDLQNAYETTIEGWSRALDIRDRETEGHTQRVTELTLRLARTMGFSEEELVHIRRGALLHDIGKLGVPDEILHKPGALTEEEWVIMRRHTQFAYDMIFPIEYLRPALDIPIYHHEKWDGTGYPQSIRGMDIPLSARIFAVVDVYDALSTDRPYRKAWSKHRVLEHIRNNSGTHFDPKVVEIFVREIQDL